MKIKRLSIHAITPSTATDGSAGIDLCACLPGDYLLREGDTYLVPTGWAMELPPGSVGLICPRSGLARKEVITVLNAPGIIDSDYRGEVKVLLINHSSRGKTIQHGDRIAQLVIVEHCACFPTIVQELSDTERGEGGFGSTGK